MKAYMFGLALLGVMLASVIGAYSMWSETLTITGTVDTGEVKVVIANYTCSDTGPDPQIPNSNFSNDEGKDVASCTVEPIEEDGMTVGLHIVLSNTYPGYEAQVTATILNAGTIPVKLLSETIDNQYPDEVSVTLSHPEDTQLHAGESQDYIVTIDVLQPAQENAGVDIPSYEFNITLVFAQWNEVP